MGVMIPGAGCAARNDSASGAQVIGGSLIFDGDENLSKTWSSHGNRKTWTFSTWVKRNVLSTGSNILFGTQVGGSDQYNYLWFTDSDELRYYGGSAASTNVINMTTNARYRDASDWYHIVLAFDTTQSTAADRFKLYVNGEQVTSWSSSTYPAQDVDYYWNSTLASHTIGTMGTVYASFQLAETQFIDGQALDASEFGFTDPLTNTWRPK